MDIQLTDTNKAELFSCIFQHIRLFTESVSVIFSPTGLYFQSMDSSRVSIIEFKLSNTWFDSYVFTHSGDIVLGINTNILFKILNAREKSQKMQIIYEIDAEDTLEIHFTSDDKTIFDKHFQFPLMDIEVETMNIPEIDYSAEFSLPSNNFAVLINQLKTFGDSLNIECTEENIQLSANSTDSGKMSVDINIDDLDSFAIDEGHSLSLSFSLTQLHNICMFNKISKDVTVSLKEQFPMCIIYPFSEEQGKLVAFLAPKITDE
jgi:proliferating cell nuclear antigen PCNA